MRNRRPRRRTAPPGLGVRLVGCGHGQPAPDPAKLLAYWNEWERGETPPGRTMANLKTHGLPVLLQSWSTSGVGQLS